MYDELIKRLRYKAGWDESGDLEQAADAIEELTVVVRAQKAVLEKFPWWIPVTERLPEKRTRVLISSGGYVGVGIYTGSYWRDECNAVISVKSWMPLPKPAKDGAE